MFSQQVLCWRPGHFMVFFSLSCGIFLYFLRTVWFLLKICTYILDNTLMIVRLKIFIGVLPFAWCWFWVCFFWGGGGRVHFQYFSLFLEKKLVCFMKFHEILRKYSWYYCGNQTQNNMACCLYFGRLFWIMLRHIFAYYTVLIALGNPKYSPVLHRFSGQ